MRETWKNGKTYEVSRDHGRFVSRKQLAPISVITREEPKGNYRYDIVIRVAYDPHNPSRASNSRRGEIAGSIISNRQLSDNEVIDKSLYHLAGEDYWLDYVEPNETIVLHISEDRTDKNEYTDLTFRDLGSK